MITVSSHASTGANIPSTNVADCLSVKKQKKKRGKIQLRFFVGSKTQKLSLAGLRTGQA